MCASYKGVQAAVEEGGDAFWKNQQMFSYVTTNVNTFRNPPTFFTAPEEEPADLKGLYY